MAGDPRQRLSGWRVGDVMSSPIRACAADMPLADAAELMAAERIHCLAVVAHTPDDDEPRFVGVLSDLDLIAALDGPGAGGTVAEHASAPLESVAADAPLGTAVHQMREARTQHLVVVAEGSGRPVGVLSTLDVAQALAGAAGARPGD
ncbi:CBS domain-containing protein [Miltoncostaea marina]|uniref:CBS domain-containing protein n=1 Tax=Miltoncostaea marina TaxID=2843215 RepID=UPI001C3E083C|nr:CBS domain-containing protein [Miltoncostaea marina]